MSEQEKLDKYRKDLKLRTTGFAKTKFNKDLEKQKEIKEHILGKSKTYKVIKIMLFVLFILIIISIIQLQSGSYAIYMLIISSVLFVIDFIIFWKYPSHLTKHEDHIMNELRSKIHHLTYD
jgi:hypothetical protein